MVNLLKRLELICIISKMAGCYNLFFVNITNYNKKSISITGYLVTLIKYHKSRKIYVRENT